MNVFHQYDIRGIYGKELDERFAYNLGKAVLKYTDAHKIIIGYDSRNGNLKLFSSLSKSIMEQGIDIVHAGLVTKPLLNWVAWKHRYDLAIYISASHNPKEYNGFKFVWNRKLLSYDHGLKDIESLMQKGVDCQLSRKKGKIVSIDYIDEYVKFLSGNLSKDFRSYMKNHNFRIIADASNGSAGETIKRFLLKNDLTYELLFTNPDGEFPGHNPNPLFAEAMNPISKKMPAFKADIGFVVDPDADRIRFVDEKGNIVDNNFMDCLVVENLLSRRGAKKGSAIVHDLIARKILSETISKCGGKPVESKVGVTNIASSMKKEKATFGSEMSGHRIFSSMDYMDSALLMLVYVLNTLCSKKNAGKKLSSLWKKYDKYPDVGELNYKLSDGKDKQAVMDAIQKHFTDNKKRYGVKEIFNLDGVSVVAKRYWFNVRLSNTEPLLRLRVEGTDKRSLAELKKILEKFIVG